MRTRIASAILALILVLVLASPTMADPPRPRRTYAWQQAWCLLPSGARFLIRPYVNMRYLGTGASGYWYKVNYPSGNVTLLCPASQLARPR